NIGLLHFIQWQIDTFAVDETFRFSQLSNPGFDAFLRDVFVPLCSGGVVCIPGSEDAILKPRRLSRWLDRYRVNLVHCVPSIFKLLEPGTLSKEQFKQLKYILFSGERIDPGDLVDWYDTFDDRIKLVNLWGTTETTMSKTCYFIDKSDLDRERIPVGQPIRGAGVLILDEDMEVCDDLVTGEITIRTPFMTHGYFNAHELNKEKFIRDPFSQNPGDIIHKTGDLGRILTGGDLELLGRQDRQVKVRGIRIELEEIESVLIKHPQVKEAVAIKEKTTANSEILCAYFTGTTEVTEAIEANQAGDTVSISQLNRYLAGKLPAYMVPARLLKIAEIPRKPNGKVDYDKLRHSWTAGESTTLPATDIFEIKVLELWHEVLSAEVENIGVRDDFFQLGGHSLSVMSLISKIHKHFDVRISLGEIFSNRTIQQQAAIIRENHERSREETYQSIKAVEKKEYYALSSAQKRLYILHRLEPGA
ncbi:MAG: non-ribosomal peptide synthetase, partial [bacterium]|nr:non-ribosomal peptide synthetase [bacterium]